MKQWFAGVVSASIVILASVQAVSAGTVTVFNSGAFNAATTGQVTTNFSGISVPYGDPTCPGSGACFNSFSPLLVNGITFSSIATNVNVNSAGYYGIGDLANQYIVNSYPPAMGSPSLDLTITLPKAVTAFALDYGTLFVSSSVSFQLSNGFSTTVNNTLSNLQTQYLGFISTTPFNTITLNVPLSASWVVEDVTTASATPLPSTWAMLFGGLVGIGYLASRGGKRGAAASRTA